MLQGELAGLVASLSSLAGLVVFVSAQRLLLVVASCALLKEQATYRSSDMQLDD
jgi:hypothetical protein